MAIWWFGVEIYAMVILFGSIYMWPMWLAMGLIGVAALAAFAWLNIVLISKTYHNNSTGARYGLMCLMLAAGVAIAAAGAFNWESDLGGVYTIGAGLYLVIAAMRLGFLTREEIAESMKTKDPTF